VRAFYHRRASGARGDTLAHSLLTLKFASRRAAPSHSFGYHRLEVVGALFSVATLWLVTGVLLTEASARLRHPEAVSGPVMTGIAAGGVVVNIVLVLVLKDAGGHGHSHGGLSGGGGCSHSHDGPSQQLGTAFEGDNGARVRVATSAPWTSAAAAFSATGGHGHSHVGGVCGSSRPLLEETSTSDAAPDTAPAPFPQGAVFFTRGRMPLPLPADTDGTFNTPPTPLPPPPTPTPPPSVTEPLLAEDTCSGDDGEAARGLDLNMRGAYMHVLGDLLQSLGVLLVGAIVWARPDLHVLDPVLTFVFGALVLATTGRLLRDIVDVIMERVPRGLSAPDIAAQLASLPGVAGVHDLHVWLLMPGKTVLTVHITCAEAHALADVLGRVQRSVTLLGIQHATVQVEVAACAV